MVLFESLKLVLDEADQNKLQHMKEEDRTLTFATFFSHLRKLYASDPTVQNRKN